MKEKVVKLIKIGFIIIWLAAIYGTKTSYISYLVLGLMGGISVSLLKGADQQQTPEKDKVIIGCIGILFAAMITLGNYDLLLGTNGIMKYGRLLGMLLGGVVCFKEIFALGYYRLRHVFFTGGHVYTLLQKKCICWGTIAIVFGCNLIYMIACVYPASVQYDTLRQMSEIYSENLTNHHPVLLTYLIKWGIDISKALGHGVTFGIFLSTLVQVIGICLVIGYVMLTLCDMSMCPSILLMFLVFFLICPFNICFITYAQKDAPFAYAILLYIVALYRLIKDVGNYKVNTILMVVGALLAAVLRSNGLMMVLITLFVIVLQHIHNKKRIVCGMLLVVVMAILYKGPVLQALDVEPTEYSEGLSIPIQQIGRVVYDQLPLTQHEEEMISALIDMDSVRYHNPYDPHCSDHIKGIIQFGGKDSYLKEHKGEYLKLWIQLGIKYPKEYLAAYIDETYGYWLPGVGDCGFQHSYLYNAGDYQIYQVIRCEWLETIINKYLSLFEQGGVLHILVENGLAVYLLFYLCVLCIWKKNGLMTLCVPNLAGILTLLLSTPLYGNQRYTVYMFVTMPFIALVTFYEKESKK